MLKRFYIFILLIIISHSNALADEIISNKYFSFTMPENMKNTYKVDKMANGIYISEKVSANLEIGGFAFGVKVFKNPKDYANIPNSKKLGELKDKKGTLYDVVLMRPSEIQYVDKQGVAQDYNRLYDFGDIVEVKGINGNQYFKNQGKEGKDLYPEIVKKYKTAIEENWDEKKFEQEKMGYIYPNLSKTNKVGYVYYDINADGIDELIIGEKDKVYDIYTMVERRPAHVLSGGDVDKFYVSDNLLCNEYSSKKNEKITKIYSLEINSTELNPTITFIKDGRKRYFSYGHSKSREKVSKKLFKERIKMFKHTEFDFIPFSKFE